MKDLLSPKVGPLGRAGDMEALEKRLDDLVSLGGREKTREMLSRLADHLDNTLPDRLEDPLDVAEIHRLVGLAGILGFNHLERCWRVLETRPFSSADLARAHKAGRAAARFARAWR